MEMHELAAHLRRPEGPQGAEIGIRMNESNRVLCEEALRYLDLNSAHELLELGMGNGGFVGDWLGRSPHIRYTGCDYSDTMVAEATRLNEELVSGGRAVFHQGDAHSLPYIDESFDRVFTANTIYFWEKPGVVLAEFYRVLRPGGLLVVALRSAETMKLMPFTEFGFQKYSKDDLIQLFADSPFGGVEIKEMFEEIRMSAGGMAMPTLSYIVVGEKG